MRKGNKRTRIKVCIYGPGHMAKMVAMPIFGENLQKSSQNQKSYDPQTWQ